MRHSTDEEKGTATMPVSAASGGATGQDDDACRNPSARRRTRAPGAQGGKCAGRRQEVAQLTEIDAAALADRANDSAFAGISR